MAGWIRDHIVGTVIVFPGAGYVCMAGEAIRQLTGRSEYSVRGLVISTAIIVNDSRENDIITTFRKAKLTLNSDSGWWEFRITFFNGSTWNEHCSGQGKAGPIHSMECEVSHPEHLRKLSASRWYSNMQKIGFTNGPSSVACEISLLTPLDMRLLLTSTILSGRTSHFTSPTLVNSTNSCN